jgi:hypothetical protein
VSVIGAAVVLAMSLTVATGGAATAGETAATRLDRFANYEHKDCINENEYFNVDAQDCATRYFSLYWYWNGALNTSSTLRHYVSDHCLDSNSAGHVYTGACNGGNNQLWQIIQPAPASAVQLRNTATRLCLYQTYGLLFGTTVCDRNSRTQRWTIG